ICQPSNTFVIRENGNFQGSYPNFNLGDALFWLLDDTNNQVAVLVQNAAGQIVDFVCAVDGFPNQIIYPLAVPASAWSGSPIAANTNLNITYQRTGNTNRHSARIGCWLPAALVLRMRG